MRRLIGHFIFILSIMLLLVVVACDREPAATPTAVSDDTDTQGLATAADDSPETDPSFTPTADTQLDAGEHHFSEFIIAGDVTVTLGGDAVIDVSGPIRIEGTVTGDCAGIEMRGAETLEIYGLVDNSCAEAESGPEIRLIAAGDITIGADVSDVAGVVSGGRILIADPDGENMDQTALPDSVVSIPRPVGAAKPVAAMQPATGTLTINTPLEPGAGGDIFLFKARGDVVVNNTLFLRSGASGGCDSADLVSQDGGGIFVGAPDGTLRVGDGVRLAAGNGGAASSCQDHACPAFATGGHGGHGGNLDLAAARIEFGSSVELSAGNGGGGGAALAMPGSASEPCTDGCDAEAIGGNGGDAGDVILVSDNITGSPSVSPGSPGPGGLADARASNGTDCPLCPGGQGGRGGNAIATGGNAGQVGSEFRGTEIVQVSRDGFRGGAEATGGNGGNGANCCQPVQEGGPGGTGGTASATPGEPEPGEGVTLGGAGQVFEMPGQGGNGGDGNPPGAAGPGGDEDSAGAPGNMCVLPTLFIGNLVGQYTHIQPGRSVITSTVDVFGTVPSLELVPGAAVTMTMIRPDSTTATMMVTTTVSGQADFAFDIAVFGSYDLVVDDVQAEGFVYEPTLNVTDTLQIQVGPGAGVPVYGDGKVRAFFNDFNQAVESQDSGVLFLRLHTAVPDLYGAEACMSYLEQVVANPVSIDVNQVTGFGQWNWEIDEVSTPIEHAYTVDVTFNLSDGTSVQQASHVALRPDGSLGWFTDCGDPLP